MSAPARSQSGCDAASVHPLLTAKQVAHRLNCSVRTVWRLVEEGVLPKITIGTLVRFAPDVIDDLISGPARGGQ